MPCFTFTVVEYDPDRPWIILSQAVHEHDATDEHALRAWAAAKWPAPRYAVSEWSISTGG